MLRRPLQGRLEIARLESRALQRNALGDPNVRSLAVYLPPGYDAGGSFPVVYVLPAYPSTALSLASDDVWKANVFDIVDRLLANAACAAAIVVGVDGSNAFGGSQFLDSSATGAYQTYLRDDVIPFVDQRYRTVASAHGRAMVGRSSGGFGALRFAMDCPGHVGAVASLAGDAGFEVSLRPMFGPACVAFEGAGGFGPFAERLRAEGPRSGGEYDAAFFVAAAAAYAPEPTAPFPHAALPVDLRTAEVIPAVWERWLAQDPLVRSETQEATDALGALTCLALDAGNRDEYGLHFAARALANRFRARGIAVDHTEFDGGHRGTTPRFEAVLPRVIAAIARR